MEPREKNPHMKTETTVEAINLITHPAGKITFQPTGMIIIHPTGMIIIHTAVMIMVVITRETIEIGMKKMIEEI